MGFNCLNATDTLREGSLIFTVKLPEIPVTHSVRGASAIFPLFCSRQYPQYQPMKYFEYIGDNTEEIIPKWQPLHI